VYVLKFDMELNVQQVSEIKYEYEKVFGYDESSIEGPIFSEDEIKDVIHRTICVDKSKLKLWKKCIVRGDERPDTMVACSLELDPDEAFKLYGTKMISFEYMTKGYYGSMAGTNYTIIDTGYLDNDHDYEFAEALRYWNPQTKSWQENVPAIYREDNPYADHQYLFTPALARKASLIQRAMSGEKNPELIDALKITADEIGLFVKLKEHLYTKLLEFEKQLPSDVFPPSREKVMSLVSRYIVQSYSQLQLDEGAVDDVTHLIDMGLKKYLEIHDIDIPLYDLLFDELDSMGKQGRLVKEIFLGRDGVYAFFGRRAQDLAQKRKQGYSGRLTLSDKEKYNYPRYLVYPRFFRDELSYEMKVDYLLQNKIVSETDPVFIDTGYTGTIPEDIMHILGISQEEFDERIRLLSSSNEKRRVGGISKTYKPDIVEKIEHNVKLENSAEGLYYDDQKIKHIAEPKNPKEQFLYLMVRHAIVSHYWKKELESNEEI
jgi:hypothetical protein